MATQKNSSSGRKSASTKKNTASGRKNATKKTNSSGKKSGGKNESKEAQGPDLVTVIVVLIAVVLVLVLISKYKKENEGKDTGNPTGAVTLTGTGIPETTTEAPEVGDDTPSPTKSVTKPPEATATPVPTPTEDPELSQTQALRIVNEIIELENYTIELLDDHLTLDGVEYYAFCVNNENGESMEPLLIVNKKKGSLMCYDLIDGMAPIEKFPLDNTETGSEGKHLLTAEDAIKVLSGYKGEWLGLAKDPSEYETEADDWTTMANGVECYGINFFEEVNGKQKFRGTFYVALDGSVVYGKDDITGEFVERMPR